MQREPMQIEAISPILYSVSTLGGTDLGVMNVAELLHWLSPRWDRASIRPTQRDPNP